MVQKETKDWVKQCQAMHEISHLISLCPGVYLSPLSFLAALRCPQLKLRLWNSCPLDADGSQWESQSPAVQARGTQHTVPPFPGTASHFLCTSLDIGNTSQDRDVLLLYLIHSVLLNSILATKALGIICRKESSESQQKMKILGMGGEREHWGKELEDIMWRIEIWEEV